MMFLHIETMTVVDRAGLEAAHMDPYVCFPQELNDAVLFDFGYALIKCWNGPNVTVEGKLATRGEIIYNKDGWYQEWIFRDPVVTKEMVDAERDRRVDSGVMFEGHKYQSRSGDRENITGAAQLATMAIMNGAERGNYRWGNPDIDFEWITDDNEIVKLDAYQTFDLGKTAAAHKQRYIFAARNIKNMDPIPVDYTDNKYWEWP